MSPNLLDGATMLDLLHGIYRESFSKHLLPIEPLPSKCDGCGDPIKYMCAHPKSLVTTYVCDQCTTDARDDGAWVITPRKDRA